MTVIEPLRVGTEIVNHQHGCSRVQYGAAISSPCPHGSTGPTVACGRYGQRAEWIARVQLQVQPVDMLPVSSG